MLGLNPLASVPLVSTSGSIITTLSALPATILIAGQGALFAHTMVASQATILIAGQNSPLDRSMNALPASILTSGQSALYTISLNPSHAVIQISGQITNLLGLFPPTARGGKLLRSGGRLTGFWKGRA